jgi:hypothetical protein
MPYLGSQHLFLFDKCCLKVTTFSAPPSIQKIHVSGGCQKEDVPLLFGGFEGAAAPLTAKKIWEL